MNNLIALNLKIIIVLDNTNTIYLNRFKGIVYKKIKNSWLPSLINYNI